MSQELHSFAPELSIFVLSTQQLYQRFQETPPRERSHFAETEALRIENELLHLKDRVPSTQILLTLFSEWDDGVFGEGSSRVESSFLFQTRALNLALMKLSARNPAIHLLDVSLIQSHLGTERFRDPRLASQADVQCSLDATALIAQRAVQKWSTLRGRLRKCLILDLDNTLWGGIIADTGIEGIEIGTLTHGRPFSELQRWAKQLKERGIILAVCSKNDETIAQSPFLYHPEMSLRLSDISVFVANYSNKADNIRYIQSVLNIGLDSMVFLDDSPYERGLVREELPAVLVPELPEDPAYYLEDLRHLHLFEALSLTHEDEARANQYSEEASRKKLQFAFTDETAFLKSLTMEAALSSLTDFHRPRVAQLSQRSNQFNLRTVRYTEDNLQSMAQDPKYCCLSVSLKDRFGDYGLISSIFLHEQEQNIFFIENWIMSCRVLKRGVEQLVLNEIARVALGRGGKLLIGEYLPTAKNSLVKDHYRTLGFQETSPLWTLNLATFERKPHWIQILEPRL